MNRSDRAAALGGADLPLISVIVPCRDEERFIGPCLESIVKNGYPHKRLEILVVDGMSQDSTREIVRDYMARYPSIRLIQNSAKIIPAALNLGIHQARGEILMRADAHALYHSGYISNCVEGLEKGRADLVGGIWVIAPREAGFLAKSIAFSLSHWFGAGNARYRAATPESSCEVDTVPYFCARKELFEQAGFFNENLAYSEDIEFTRRIRKLGKRILLLPSVVSTYFARANLKSFWQHSFRNGVWAVLPWAYCSHMPVAARHLVPMAFVLTGSGAVILGVGFPAWAWLTWVFLGVYALVSLTSSSHIAWRESDPRYVLTMPLVFATLHISYGLGSLWGLIRLAKGAGRRPGVRAPSPGS